MQQKRKNAVRKSVALFISLVMIASAFMTAGLTGVYAAATGIPATPSLSHDNWDGDGSYNLTMNVWWGNNGTSVKFYENGQLISTDTLTDNSPSQQSFKKTISGKAKGTYKYTCELINSFGKATSSEVIVNVTIGSVNPTTNPPTTNPPTINPPTGKPTTPPPPTPNGVKPWAPNTYYTTGTQVSYNGSIYTCLQPHTSMPGWEPTNVASLWKLSTGTVTTPPTTTSTPTTKPSTPPPATTTPPPTTVVPPTSGYKIVGYLADWADWSNVKANQMTHINYAFANCVNSEVVGGDASKLAQLKNFKQANPNLKTLVSVGGWTWSKGFHDAALTDANRTKFADSAVRYIKQYGLDGVDLDWEYPGQPGDGNPYGPEDKHNFTLMLQKIREKLNAQGATDGKQYLLTIASGANYTYAENTELGIIHQYLDNINIMTYDFSGGWVSQTAHHTNLYKSTMSPNGSISSDLAVNIHIQNGVPAKKIVLGVAFYGRGFNGVSSSTNNGLGQSYSGGASEYSYTQLSSSYINKNGYVRYWDDAAKAPYLWNASQKSLITYDDVESLGHKSSYIKSKGLGGAMFWEYTQDSTGTLLNKLYTDLK
ncbi:MAG: glycosyl hydrolase family 18 protein [Clostridia bacterium]|nr:glycosyl hydrolase family 18 protein [Clostridia bacterium]